MHKDHYKGELKTNLSEMFKMKRENQSNYKILKYSQYYYNLKKRSQFCRKKKKNFKTIIL